MESELFSKAINLPSNSLKLKPKNLFKEPEEYVRELYGREVIPQVVDEQFMRETLLDEDGHLKHLRPLKCLLFARKHCSPVGPRINKTIEWAYLLAV